MSFLGGFVCGIVFSGAVLLLIVVALASEGDGE
jgi:hypothetical protein